MAFKSPQQVEAVTPKEEYARRLSQRRQDAGRHARQHHLLANARLAVFLIGCVIAWFVFGPSRISAGWLLVPAVFFVVLVIRHDAARQAMRRAERAAAFYERGLARIENRWAGTGQPGTRFLDDNHPYALDLDLFGRGSLFELLCTARTRNGEATLAAWLLAPAAPQTVLARQAAGAELRGKLDWREALALLGTDVPEGVDLDGLVAWGAAPAVVFPAWSRAAAIALPVLALLALVAWLTFDLGLTPLVLVVMVEIAVTLKVRAGTERILAPVERRAHDLALFAGLLHALERESFAAEPLRRLQAGLSTEGLPPSHRIAQLQRHIDWLNARRNQLFAPIAFVLLWHLRYAFRIEAWRRLAGTAITRWLAVVGELEALAALAAYSFENPLDPFPEVCRQGPCFDGEGLGHPLLSRATCVTNDVSLASENGVGDAGENASECPSVQDPRPRFQVLMVSGSNMSGKSTLLRTVGINAVLGLAGAPVRARRLRLSPLTVGATLRVQDSLQEGRSRFYAEILRVRQLVELARDKPPLLFLLDELFQGTNSNDRRLGAEAVIRGLLDHRAVGLVTTHDLALTQIVGRIGPRAANVHFQDHFESGAMTFDYRMRPGVVEHSNALALMRAVGIEV
jgi:hypothetical protein